MSAAIRATSSKQRATIAINMFKKNTTFSRKFDIVLKCQVMEHIIEKARTDKVDGIRQTPKIILMKRIQKEGRFAVEAIQFTVRWHGSKDRL
ncbi:hypothetical protein [Cytobacillus oceanisediminis]|uniref:Uncharacterized protein n=1 Tax=Cytobacillus oceanisediminis TaxID=665099 RepID=A0A562K6H3_9BACI|nr:hypothetical protein [Cytobacillus oceanisediminis]TWH90853.1 hypothetical protein IQ19_00303 [Cytobacillus oceanisediminis]